MNVFNSGGSAGIGGAGGSGCSGGEGFVLDPSLVEETKAICAHMGGRQPNYREWNIFFDTSPGAGGSMDSEIYDKMRAAHRLAVLGYLRQSSASW
jgi:hypothetical protein